MIRTNIILIVNKVSCFNNNQCRFVFHNTHLLTFMLSYILGTISLGRHALFPLPIMLFLMKPNLFSTLLLDNLEIVCIADSVESWFLIFKTEMPCLIAMPVHKGTMCNLSSIILKRPGQKKLLVMSSLEFSPFSINIKKIDHIYMNKGINFVSRTKQITYAIWKAGSFCRSTFYIKIL